MIRKMILFAPAMIMMVLVYRASVIDKEIMERGKKIYTTYCMSCHQADGGGVPGLNPPLGKTSWVLGSKTKLITVVLKGMNTHEEIDGEEYTNTMAPFNFLKDQEISDLLTFVRNSFGNKATAVTVGDVKYVRGKVK
jgi:mono/diheme cytochrome c family protein